MRHEDQQPDRHGFDEGEDPREECGSCGGSGGGDYPGIYCRTCRGTGRNPEAVRAEEEARAEARAEAEIDRIEFGRDEMMPTEGDL